MGQLVPGTDMHTMDLSELVKRLMIYFSVSLLTTTCILMFPLH